MSDRLVIGVGHEQRGDDAAGLLVARRLADTAASAAPDLRVLEHGGDGMDLLLAWEGAAHVFLIDAVVSGARPPGELHRFDAHRVPLPSALFAGTSTHALGVAEAIELGRSLGRLPERVVVYGIEGERFDTGTGPGPEVLAAVERVAGRLFEELASGESHDA